MKKEQNKGITLVALVITIIVLLILAGVTISSLSGDNGILTRASNAKENTIKADIIEQIKVDMMSKQVMQEGSAVLSENDFMTIIRKYGEIDKSDADALKTRNLITSSGKYKIPISEILIEIGANVDLKDKSGANDPVLPKGTSYEYVTWNQSGTGEPICSRERPANWYNYDEGKWANIKTTGNGLEAYWVWIPRFSWVEPNSATATKIDVEFVRDKEKPANVHPAFTFGNDELEGIWVAKFEASSDTPNPDSNYGGGNVTNLNVQVKPSVQSWRNISVDNIFKVCRNMQVNGTLAQSINADGHMMKNTEWGAVTILSQSKYGVFNSNSSNNGQVWNNPNGYNSGKYIYTGYTGNDVNAYTSWNSVDKPQNIYAYNTLEGTKGSTTGNIYGIYDMAGGSWEYVAGCLENQKNEKFNSISEVKYIDIYKNGTDGNYDQTKDDIKGDAVEKTKNWNSDYAYFPTSGGPVFGRGGYCSNGAVAGVFSFINCTGGAGVSASFRPVFACVPSL